MLDVASIAKSYPSVQALDDVSFGVGRGEIVGFLGPNGAGKTTTMRAVMGLLMLDSGRITWGGEPLEPEVRRGFGYLPAERGMYPRMRVRDQLLYYTKLSGLNARFAARATDEWIERLELGAYTTSAVQTLSSGNQQRVQLAMALSSSPDLLLLDEPFSGLDPIAVASLSDTLRAEADRGAAVLLSSHQLDLVAALCTSVVVVHHGRIVLRGDVTALREASHTRIFTVTFTEAVDWQPEGIDTHVIGPNRYEVRLDDHPDPRDVVDQALRAGSVTEYAWRPPDLSEIFLAVTGSTSSKSVETS